MARTRTLTQLRSDVRVIADVEGETDRHPDAMLTRWINQSIQAFRLMVSTAGSPYYITTTAAADTVSGTASYALPSDFVEAYGVDLTVNGYTVALPQYEFAERADYTRSAQDSDSMPAYWRVQGSNLVMIPTPDGAYSYQLHYLPTGTDLSADADTFDGIAGWEDWIVYDVALKVLTRDDEDEQAAKVASLLQKRTTEIMRHAGRRSRIPSRRVDTMRRRGEAVAGAAARWRW